MRRENFVMKRLLAVFLTSCMIVGLASPAGTGLMTEIKANTEAAFSNLGATESRTESASEGTESFDEAIRSLYDNSMSATDEEVLARENILLMSCLPMTRCAPWFPGSKSTAALSKEELLYSTFTSG